MATEGGRYKGEGTLEAVDAAPPEQQQKDAYED
jgi:hypothetical protein